MNKPKRYKFVRDIMGPSCDCCMAVGNSFDKVNLQYYYLASEADALLAQYAGREQRLRDLLPELEALAYTAITELANENEGHWAPIMEITNKFRAILNKGEK